MSQPWENSSGQPIVNDVGAIIENSGCVCDDCEDSGIADVGTTPEVLEATFADWYPGSGSGVDCADCDNINVTFQLRRVPCNCQWRFIDPDCDVGSPGVCCLGTIVLGLVGDGIGGTVDTQIEKLSCNATSFGHVTSGSATLRETLGSPEAIPTDLSALLDGKVLDEVFSTTNITGLCRPDPGGTITLNVP